MFIVTASGLQLFANDSSVVLGPCYIVQGGLVRPFGSTSRVENLLARVKVRWWLFLVGRKRKHQQYAEAYWTLRIGSISNVRQARLEFRHLRRYCVGAKLLLVEIIGGNNHDTQNHSDCHRLFAGRMRLGCWKSPDASARVHADD